MQRLVRGRLYVLSIVTPVLLTVGTLAVEESTAAVHRAHAARVWTMNVLPASSETCGDAARRWAVQHREAGDARDLKREAGRWPYVSWLTRLSR